MSVKMQTLGIPTDNHEIKCRRSPRECISPGAASHEACDRQRVLWAAESLRQALLEAEEMYLEAEENG